MRTEANGKNGARRVWVVEIGHTFPYVVWCQTMRGRFLAQITSFDLRSHYVLIKWGVALATAQVEMRTLLDRPFLPLLW